MTDARTFVDALRERVKGDVIPEASLAAFTTYRIGGPADVLVEAETVEDLVAVAEIAGGHVPVAIVGRGSNMLVSDDGFRGIAVRLGRAFRDHDVVEDGFVFGGSTYLPAAAKVTARHGFAGFEFAAEIPATFGGAVRMNAGAHGRSMADVLVWADVVDLSGGGPRRLGVDDLGYRYRHSELAAHEIVVRGRVRLEPGDPDEVGSKISELLEWRREHQPGGRSAGSIFKNPPGDSAGRLIDAAGLKGERIGGAEVSAVHANFIVADREAKAVDVWRLIRRAQDAVRKHAGVELECEVQFLGTFPQVEP